MAPNPGRAPPPHCLLIPSFPEHYGALEVALRSFHRHAADLSAVQVHIVLDRVLDATATLFERWHEAFYGHGSAAEDHHFRVHALEGLMRDAGEDAASDPHVRALLEEARRRHCTGAGGRGAHLCGAAFLGSGSGDGLFHSRCRQRCMSGLQPLLASLPPLPANASASDRMRQVARSASVASGRRRAPAVMDTPAASPGRSPGRLPINESACRSDCEAISKIIAQFREQTGAVATDSFDLFAPENKMWLVDLGSPLHGPPTCKPDAPWGHYNFKRKYQALKKWYGAQHAYRRAHCSLIWVMDSDSVAFRRFSFADVFGRYLARPSIFLGGPTSPRASRCHMETLFANWGEGGDVPGDRSGRNRAAAPDPLGAVDLEPFHDDLWLWEGAIVDDLLTRMRRARDPSRRRSVAAAFLNGSVLGTYSEQIVYSNWILVAQRRDPSKYAHVRRVDVEGLAVARWPHLELDRHLRQLRSSSRKHAAPGTARGGRAAASHPMLGPTLARLRAAFSLGLQGLATPTARDPPEATAAALRREFIGLLNDTDWVYVRGWQPSPWAAVIDLLPEWPGALCMSNCALDEGEVRAIKRKLLTPT